MSAPVVVLPYSSKILGAELLVGPHYLGQFHPLEIISWQEAGQTMTDLSITRETCLLKARRGHTRVPMYAASGVTKLCISRPRSLRLCLCPQLLKPLSCASHIPTSPSVGRMEKGILAKGVEDTIVLGGAPKIAETFKVPARRRLTNSDPLPYNPVFDAPKVSFAPSCGEGPGSG